MKRFPKTLNVVQNGEGEDAFLMTVDLNKDDMGEFDGASIATYEKVSVGTLRISKPVIE